MVVRAGANSDVEVVVSSDGDDVESLEIVRIVVDVASAARVRIAEVCNVGSRVRRISSVVGRVERDASLSIAHAALGGAATRTRFDGAAIEAALAWNPTALDELPTWPAERWSALLASLTEASGARAATCERCIWAPATNAMTYGRSSDTRPPTRRRTWCSRARSTVDLVRCTRV